MNALAIIAKLEPALLTPATQADFDISSFRVFNSVPDHRDIGIVALAGRVIIYDRSAFDQENIVEGAFYVRETQRAPSCMPWESWLRYEWTDRDRALGPRSPLTIRREVVQAIRWPYAENWSLRLSSGFVDGPFHDWAFGTDFIGRVVGVYHPVTGEGR